jgi:D-sedoheptulose 7-phosphate isomerase
VKHTIGESIHDTFDEHLRVLATAAEKLAPVLEQTIELALASLEGGGKLLVCGNGGSAADAQHLVAEVVCRFRHNRRALPAIALAADMSSMTAIANDFGYDRVFARQVEALGQEGDLLIAISTSGNSANVIEAAETAASIGCRVAAFTGESGGRLAEIADVCVRAPSNVVARIQEVHEVCVHLLAGVIEDHLIGGQE